MFGFIKKAAKTVARVTVVAATKRASEAITTFIKDFGKKKDTNG